MTTNTYEFTAFSEADLLSGGDTNLNCGDSFTMPGEATTCISVSDNDSFLSGDSCHNENADDSTGQNASIVDANSGNELGNGGQIYAESYFWVKDNAGNWYVMIEIEQEGVDNADFFTFYTGGGYSAPAAGTELTVHSKCNVNSNWIDYKCLDAGEKEENPGSISGRYFNDENCDGLEGAHEAGFDDKLIRLRDADTGEIVAETRTDANGNYSFDNVEPGRYCVIFEPMDGFSPTARDVGHDDTIDSDLKSNGESHIFTVEPGEHEDNIDAGVKAEPGWIKGRLTFDEDCNDNEFNDETGAWDRGVEGKVVQLLNLAGDVVAESTTDSYGNYQFDVPAGQYQVSFPKPDGFEFSAKDSGVDEHFDSDADANGLTDVIDLHPGQMIADIDAGLKAEPGSISGRYFNDENCDGLEGAHESGFDDKLIRLRDADTGEIVAETRTDANGNYSFDNVEPGRYCVIFEPMDGFSPTARDVGHDDTIDSDLKSNGESHIFTVEPGEHEDNIDAGVKAEPGTISGSVFCDIDCDGTNGTETVVAGSDYVIEAEDMHKYNYETVHGSQASGGQLARLKQAGGDGDLWTDFTGQSGVYDVTIRIQDESDGQSKVFFKVGGELVEVIKLDRDTDGYGSNNGGFSEFVIKDVPIDNGEQIKLWVGGDHGEFVRVDNIILEGQDTVVEAAEPAKGGVSVALLDADGNAVLDGAGDPITTVTDADGNYSFEGVAPGDYKVEFTAPDGTVFTEQDVGSDETIDSDVDATGRSDTITLAPGGSVDVDAGLKDAPVCIEENTTFVTDLDLTVECPDGTIAEPNLIYSIEGGADAALFQVDPTTGELSFINAPDFENPLDAGGDNFYDVVVRATTNAPAIEEVHIDFQTLADGSALEAGDNGALVLDGVTFTAIRSHDHDNVLDDAMIFDAENPTGWDHDLGQAGQGNILIISEDGDSSDPDDEAHGGTFYATFDTPSTVKSIVVLDTEESGSIELFDVDGNVLATINIPAIANGTLQTIDLGDTANVASMAVHLCGSGALDDLKFLRENEPKFVEKQLEIEVKDVDEAGSISGRSFCDIDGNALDNVGDTAIVQQLVVLLNPDGTAVLNSLGEAIITFTQSDGSYSFAEVPVGDYRVGFEVLGGKDFVAQGEDADNDGRSDDTTASDVDDAAAPISVSLGVVSIDVQTTDVFTVNPGEDVADVDAGLFIPNSGPDAIDDAFLTDEDGFLAGDLLGNDSDPENDALEIVSANGIDVGTAFNVTSTGGREGSVVVAASGVLNFAFDTISNFNDLALGETDTVTVSYTITDGNGLTDTADVVVTVQGLNDGPVAVDDATSVDEDSAISIDLLGNDSDPDASDVLSILGANGVDVGTAFTVTSADGREGTAIVAPGGVLNFAFDTSGNFGDLALGETDTVTVTYTITDGNGLTDTADVVVTVNGLNDGPVAVDDATSVDEDSAISIDLLGNDSDPDASDVLSILGANGVDVGVAFSVTSADGREGTAIVAPGGLLNFAFDTSGNFGDLAQDETDTVTVSYTITDGNGLTDTADVVVTVNGLNEGPDAIDDAFTIPEDGVALGDLLANDSDPNDDELTILEAGGVPVGTAFTLTSVGGRDGTAIVAPNGTLNFAFDTTRNFTDLNEGDTDTITLSYTITDGFGLTDTADVTVTVEGTGLPTALVSGKIDNTGPGDRHLAVILDASDGAVSLANAFADEDLDGDGNDGTAMDHMLGKISDLALTLESTDLITLIPSGLSGLPDTAVSVTFAVGVLQDAIASDLSDGTVDAQQAVFGDIVASYQSMDFTLDLEQSFDAAAEAFNAAAGFEQNKVITMVASNPTFIGQGGETFFFGDDVPGAFVDLEAAPANADVDVLIVTADEFSLAGVLSDLDSDGVADVNGASAAFDLATLITPAPTVSSAAELVSFEITVDGVAQADFDLSDLTTSADSFDFAFSEVLEGEIDVIIGLDTNSDGNADLTRSLSDDLSAAERTLAQGDVFEFTLDAFLSDQLV